MNDIYRSLFEHGLEGVFRTTVEGNYVLANRALARLYGYATPEDLMQALTNLDHQLYVDPGRRKEFVRLMKEDQEVTEFESQVWRRDGGKLWISETARAVCNENGMVEYYEGTVHDISRRKNAEEALRDSQRFIERVADTSPAILYVYDMLEGRYVYANHQVQKILGYSVEEFFGMAPFFITDLAHPEDAPLMTERATRLEGAQDGEIFETCVRLKGAGGDWLWILSRDTVFKRTAGGAPEQIIGMAEDVTASRLAHQTLEESRGQLRALSVRLQRVREEERSAIAREVHDELGQEITALNMEIAAMRACVARSTESLPEVIERLASMEGTLETMLHTVRRISAELRPPLLDEFGLDAAMQWQAKEFQKRYGVRCELTVRNDTPVDPKLSEAVIAIVQESLTNIARHAKASKIQVQMLQTTDLLVVTVKDNGRGISQEEQSASLGLLGMRERALLFGGGVEIQGVTGRGTTVTLRIPVARATMQDGSQLLKAYPKKETLFGEAIFAGKLPRAEEAIPTGIDLKNT